MRTTFPLLLLLAACGGGSGAPVDAPVFAVQTSTDVVNIREATRCPDGSVVVTGWVVGETTWGAGQPSETSVDLEGDHQFVAKYEAGGAFAWVRIIENGTSNDNHVAALADGSVVAAGDVSSECRIARYAADGSVLWERLFQGVRIRGLASTADGGFVAAGELRGSLDVDGTSLSVPDRATHVLVLRFDAAGTVLWGATAGGPADRSNVARAVGVEAGGGIFVAGQFNDGCDFGAVTLSTASNFQGFVARYGADGSFDWVRAINASGPVSTDALAAFPDGSCAVAGRIHETTTFAGTEVRDGPGLYVARFGSDGALAGVTEVRSTGGFRQHVQAEALDDGSLLVAGTFSEMVEIDVARFEADDDAAFLARLRSDGSLAWARYEPLEGAAQSTGLAVGGGEYVWAGSYDADLGVTFFRDAIVRAAEAGQEGGIWIVRGSVR